MAHADELIGRTLGHFRVLSLLGYGGMGIVYRAEDLDLYRAVALKVLPPAWASEEARRARFLREARSAAAVSHANIATIYEVGASEMTVFIAMELVRGATLREALGRGLDRNRVFAIGLGIARGLARAHEAGVLHCDLKPENVMLDREGEPKILDFGLARAISEGPGRTSMAGMIVGTPGYLSPEQALGAVLDARSDVFALGILLYELYTGRLPFDPADPLGVIYGEPAPIEDAGVPPPVAAVIERCLAREPAARFADAGEVRDALMALRRDARAASVPAPAPAPGDALATGPTLLPPAIEPTLSDLGFDDTPFVGRDAEVRDIIGRFDSGQRWVTLVGPGGIGKSRIAREVALQLLRRDRRPTSMVELGTARTAEDALDVLARAIGAQLSPGVDYLEALGLSLGSHGRLLLLLDEADGVARALGGPVSACLAAAPDAIVLCTSRERLGGVGEGVVEVGPLDVEAAAELFLERARAARTGIRDDDETRAVARDIARRLDGSPLAIDLAAARAAVLTPSAIRDRLDDRFRLLTSRQRTGRHGSLRAVLEWSWSLLDDGERAAIARMSVFHGGASVEAAEAVVVVPGAYVLDLLDSLRAKSLLRVADHRSSGTRFVMDESVRLYAEESLRAEPDGWSATCRRHARYFAGAAEEAAATSAEGVEASGDEWLDAERDNLIVAADRAIAGEGPSLDDGARAAAALARSRGEHGAGGIVRDRIGALVGRVPELDAGVAVDLLCARVRFEVDLGMPSSCDHAEMAVALAERAGHPVRLDRARSALVLALAYSDDVARAIEIGELALERARASGSALLEEAARIDLARAHFRALDPAPTITTIEPAIASARARGARRSLPEMLLLLGTAFGARGEAERSAEVEREALDGARVAGVDRVVSSALANLGLTMQQLRRPDEARELLEEAVARFERRGQTMLLARAHGNLGFLEHEARAFTVARSHYDRAAALLAHTSEHAWRAIFMGASATTLAQAGLVDDASRQFDAADAVARGVDHPLARDVLALLRAHLDVARARAATDEPIRTALLASARATLDGADPASRIDVLRSAAQSLTWALADAESRSGG